MKELIKKTNEKSTTKKQHETLKPYDEKATLKQERRWQKS